MELSPTDSYTVVHCLDCGWTEVAPDEDTSSVDDVFCSECQSTNLDIESGRKAKEVQPLECRHAEETTED